MAKQRYSMDEEKIARLLAQGRGSGDGAGYLPFLKVRDVPSLGRRSRIFGRTTGRLHHLMSDLETSAFLHADWQDDVTDIKEQHPLDRDVTRRIARGMRVRHPRDTRAATDVVMTTDLLVVRHSGCHAYSVKYSKDLGGRRGRRVRQKLEIERRYWKLEGVPFTVVTERQLSKVRRDNLAWLHPYHNVANHPWPRPGYWFDRGADLLRIMRNLEPQVSIEALIVALERPGLFEFGEVLSIMRWLMCMKIVEFDLNRRFDVRWPVSDLVFPRELIN